MDNDELAVALVRAKHTFRCDLLPDVAARLIGRVSMHYSLGASYRDSLNRVMNPTEWPDRKKRLAYRQVIGKVLGRRGGLARTKRAA